MMKHGTFARGVSTLEPLDQQSHQSCDRYSVTQARSLLFVGRKYMHLYLTKTMPYPKDAVGDWTMKQMLTYFSPYSWIL